MADRKTIAGGCFCGNIRYAISPGQYRVVNCHCSMCRKISAAPYVTWTVVRRENFRYTQGTAKVLASSATGTRHFCPDCGTPMVFFEQDRPADFDVTTCSMDEPERFPPTADVHQESRLTWL